MEANKKSYSKTYSKGFEITDDALVFINDTLQKVTVLNKERFREFKTKVKITFTCIGDK